MDEQIIAAEDAAGRLDKYIADHTGISRSFAAKLAGEGKITVNGKTSDKKTLIKPGDKIIIEIPEPEQLEARPQNIPIEIVYEDDWVIVVNKPQGMVVHPAPGNPDGTLEIGRAHV